MKLIVIAAAAVSLVCVPAAALATDDEEILVELDPLVANEDFYLADPQLEGLVTILLAENPRIQSAHAIWRSRIERVPQQKSLPDPRLSYRYFVESVETRVGPQVQGLEFTQGLPWAGKREQQAQRAGHAASAVAWSARDLERSLVAELKNHYFEAAYLQEALTVNLEETALLRRFEQIALTRYSTGEGIQQSVIKVQTDISRLADQQTALQEQLDATTRRLAELIGRPGSELDPDPIALDLPELEYDRQALADESVRDHPRVHSVERSIRADHAWLRRQELEGRPDFRVGLGYIDVGRRDDPAGVANPPPDNGKDAWAVSVGVNLPVFRKRIRAGVAEAQQSVQAGEQLLRSTRNRLQLTIQETVLRLESIDHRARLYRDVIVPQAGESLASAEAAYTTNRLDFLDLLDAQRVLFQVRLTYHRLLADYWKALADLEQSLGSRFPAGGGQS